ncbi:NAD-dependent epimerase/dehydratase family protein [Streptomyces sp. DSM 44915]|uniref:NAD-dependent epimerase/dehydratase family protein n=1 Tax=Streptomyces chisholmiae TaxID=3075540 RepID=A0ABU2JMT9_9ACTN|nr:NAD-dependent epimerase/dehydratase family protein [Streptomyces sp. DSM 44915]MDT0266310.1 NAD-dependent epimerase/dehydratase family protein [Streptomyces sp. DSM 44915]
MRLLLLGGTEFAGPPLVHEALARGWRVTVFNRGRSPAPPGVTALRGDRLAPGGLAALADGTWDLVVDTWSEAPVAVQATARLLAGRAGHYSYLSSRSVYAFPPPAGANEDSPVVAGAPDAERTEYAADKRGGELAAQREFGVDRALLVRCGLLLGPYENVGRLPWWLRRIARGGEVLAPGPAELPLQYLDIRDLARWTLDAAARGLTGPYDLVSPPGASTMGELLTACAAVTGSAATFRWLTPEAVLAAGIEPWTELPCWLPPGPLHAGLHGSDVSRALAAGLTVRPVAETVRDTWRWLGELPPGTRLGGLRSPIGLPEEKEARALAG